MLGFGVYIGSGKPTNHKPAIPTAELSEKANTTNATQTSTDNINKKPLTKSTNPQTTEQPQYISLNTIFLQLLNNGKYESAMEMYESVESSTLDEPHTLRTAFIKHIQSLLLSKPIDHQRIAFAIDEYLKDYYDDTDVLLLAATQQSLDNKPYETINTYQLATYYAFTHDEKKKVEEQFRLWATYLFEFYATRKEWATLANIYTFADNAELLSEADRLSLINIYLNLNDVHQAKLEAEKLPTTAEWKTAATDIFSQHGISKTDNNSKQENSSESVVRIQNNNNQFIVPLTLSQTEVNLLLDTGASMTTISKTHFNQLRASLRTTYQRSQNFITANGETKGDIYTIDEVTLGNHTLYDINLAVLDYPAKSSQGLLGMNILQYFEFTIDQEESLLKLNKR